MDNDGQEVGTTEGLPTVDDDGMDTSGADARAEGEGTQATTLQDRIRQDPDFAWEQIRSRDQRISESSNQLKQLDELRPFIDLAGGTNELLRHAVLGEQIGQVPGLKEIVQNALSQGRVTLPEASQPQGAANDQDDEWIDPDVKRVRDETNSQISELKGVIQQLQSQLSSTSLRSQETHVQRNIDKAIEMLGDVGEAKEEALRLIGERVSVAQRQAETGNVQQARLIEQLAGEGGDRILRSLLLDEGIFQKYGPQIFAGNTNSNDNSAERVVERSTDAPTRNASRPGTPPLPPVPKGRVSVNTARMIHAELQRRRGISPTS